MSRTFDENTAKQLQLSLILQQTLISDAQKEYCTTKSIESAKKVSELVTGLNNMLIAIGYANALKLTDITKESLGTIVFQMDLMSRNSDNK